MEEDYELISKGLMSELRTENKKLKKDVETIAKNSQVEIDYKKLAQEIAIVLREENVNDKKQIEDSFEHIKELNKTTLNNLLDKTQKLENKFEELVSTISELTDNVGQLVGAIDGKEINNDLKEIVENLKNVKSEPVNSGSESLDIDIVMNKLKEIEEFMDNLKILLASVKPGDMRLERNSF